mmetsp:Transcript_37064/g.91605  ORF Transcript_37064/g.91605 Transcript_37064/m.91605 type:complete len:202 (-) Transcript_37064:728-1333(-)
MQLYERRVASLQRFVAMCVMFHAMGRRVADFWPAASLGVLGYRMDRTHSIMRIATTASPVSGADVRERMHFLALRSEFSRAVHVIRTALSDLTTATYYKNKFSAHNQAAAAANGSSTSTGTGAGGAHLVQHHHRSAALGAIAESTSPASATTPPSASAAAAASTGQVQIGFRSKGSKLYATSPDLVGRRNLDGAGAGAASP